MRIRRTWMLFVSLVGFAAMQDPQPQGRLKTQGRSGGSPVVRQPDGKALQHAQQLSRTTAEHDQLARLAGKWRVSVRTSSDGSGQVREDQGTCVGQAILGGRYVVLNFQLQLQGRKVEAVQLIGFDTLRKVYTASWRDSATTWSIECEGEPGKLPDVLSLRGLMVDAFTPDGRAFRMELDLGVKDQVDVRIYEQDGAGRGEVLLQEQQWRR